MGATLPPNAPRKSRKRKANEDLEGFVVGKHNTSHDNEYTPPSDQEEKSDSDASSDSSVWDDKDEDSDALAEFVAAAARKHKHTTTKSRMRKRRKVDYKLDTIDHDFDDMLIDDDAPKVRKPRARVRGTDSASRTAPDPGYLGVPQYHQDAVEDDDEEVKVKIKLRASPTPAPVRHGKRAAKPCTGFPTITEDIEMAEAADTACSLEQDLPVPGAPRKDRGYRHAYPPGVPTAASIVLKAMQEVKEFRKRPASAAVAPMSSAAAYARAMTALINLTDLPRIIVAKIAKLPKPNPNNNYTITEREVRERYKDFLLDIKHRVRGNCKLDRVMSRDLALLMYCRTVQALQADILLVNALIAMDAATRKKCLKDVRK